MQILSLPVVAAAACALALAGCGSAPAPAPSPLRMGWDNHFAAFGEGVAAQDAEDPSQGQEAALDRIMQDYDEASVVRIWEYGATDQPSLYRGSSEIRQMFDGLFGALAGCNGAADNQLKAGLEVDEAGSQVFLVWKCEAAGFYRVTDTFVFDGAIIRIQNIVVGKSQSAMAAEKEGDALVRRLSYDPTTVAEAWANHADAFMAGAAAGSATPVAEANLTAALDKIMLDYTDSSVVRIFNFATDDMAAESPFTEHTGMAEIRAMFDGLFHSFSNPTPPVVPLADEWPELGGGIFLIWAAPDSGYLEATDTFIFDSDFKIFRQNIAINAPAPPASYQCSVCQHIYNPADNNGVAFEDLPEDWTCPVCGNAKSVFSKIEEEGHTEYV